MTTKTKEKKSFLQTAGMLREPLEPVFKNPAMISMHELQDGRLNLTAKDFVMRFGLEEDFLEVKKKIETRRSQVPAFSYWKCNNKGCGWEAKFSGEKEGKAMACLRCNQMQYRSGGTLIRQSQEWGIEWEKREAEKDRRELAQMRLSNFNAANEKRKIAGLSPFSWKAWEEQERQLFAQRMRAHIPKAKE
jgi:hypothetical protein